MGDLSMLLRALATLSLILTAAFAGASSAAAADTTVTGTVTASGGAPVSDGYLTATDGSLNDWGDLRVHEGYLEQDGTFVIELPPGTYEVCTQIDYEYRLTNECQDVAVGPAGVTGLTFALEPMPRVTGVVTAQGGDPVTEGELTASDGSLDPYGDPVTYETYLEPDGTFAFPLPPGTYEVCTQIDYEVGLLNQCQDVTVGPAGVTGLAFSLESMPRVTGVTSNDNGVPVSVTVDLYEAGSGTVGYTLYRAQSDTDGHYAVAAPAGTYTLCAGRETGGPVDRQCWPDVVVSDDGLSGRDLFLQRNSVVTGQVSVAGDPYGDLSSLHIDAFEFTPGATTASQWHTGSVAADGSYAMALPPGEYLFRFRSLRGSSLGVEELFWPAQSDAAQRFTVGAGEVAGPDPVLTQSSGLMGSLTVLPTPADPESWDEYRILAYPESATSLGNYANDRSREFRAGGVATERWHVSVDPGKYRIAFRRESDGTYLWYGGGTSLETAPLVEVTAGTATQGLHGKWGTSLDPYTFGRPTISGAAQPGQTLTANPNPSTWPAGTTFTYEWPDGSTEPTYAVSQRDEQAFAPMISVAVTGHTPGYAPVTRTTPVASTEGVTPPPALAFPSGLAIKGRALVGSTVSVVKYQVGPDVSYSFKWYAGKKRLTKATTAKYRIPRALRGQVLSVVVTASRGDEKIAKRLRVGRVK